MEERLFENMDIRTALLGFGAMRLPLDGKGAIDRTEAEKMLDLAYENVAKPCLHITGTADNSIVGTTQASQRRLPFDHTFGADQYLVTFYGADHMVYAGHLRAANGTHDAMYQHRIAECSAVFWDAYLKAIPGAKAWLTGDGMRDRLQTTARVERKLADDRTAER